MINRLFNRNDNLAILIAGIFSVIVGLGVSRFAFTSLLPTMLDDFLSIKFAGQLASLNFVGYLSGSILSIFIRDFSIKVKLFRIGLSFALLSTLILGYTTNDLIWIVVRIVAGLAAAMVFVVGSAIVMSKLTFKSKTKAMGIHFSGLGFSIFVTDLVVRFVLAEGGDWSLAWIVLSFFGLVLSAYAWYILSFEKVVKTKTVKTKFDFSVFTSFSIILLLAYFTEGVGFVIQGTFLPEIINNVPGLEGYGNLIWTFAGLAGVPSCIIWMRLAHRFGSVNMIMIALALQIVGILIPTFTTNMYLNGLSGVLYGGTFAGLVALFMTLGGQLSKGNPVVLMGAITTAYGIGQVVGPLYAVYLVDKFHTYNYALYLTAFTVFLGIVLMFFGKKLQPKTL